MVRSAAIAGSLVLLAGIAGAGQTASAETLPAPTRWQFAPDFRSHPGHNPFTSYQGGAAVWSLRQGHSLTRNGDYPLLKSFSSTFGAAGLKAWHGSSLNCVHVPAVGVNTSEAPVQLCRGQVPGKAAFARPSSTRLAVIAWTSPFTGTVKVSHDAIADVDGACGDGVSYFVALGTRTLQSKRLKNNDATTLATTTQTIRAGQSLYFIVSPGPSRNASCDTTQLQLTIDRVGDPRGLCTGALTAGVNSRTGSGSEEEVLYWQRKLHPAGRGSFDPGDAHGPSTMKRLRPRR